MRGLKRRISRARRSAESMREFCWGEGSAVGGMGWGAGGGRYLDVADASEIHHGAAEGAEGVLDVKGEADALAEEELAGQYLLGGLSAKVFDEAAGGLVVPPVYPRNARRTR